MTVEPDILGQTKFWFSLAVPKPQAKNQTVQMGVHLEEVAEMLSMIQSTNPQVTAKIEAARATMYILADALKADAPESLSVSIIDFEEFLDSLCDQIVTAVGCAHMYTLDILGGMKEVNGSNFSKFVDGLPVFDDNGKIKKGPNYYQANLAPFI